jgi:CoA:oxalate CoA-transferase
MEPVQPVFTTEPLAGVRVLDLGVGGVGPWAGETLAQLGASVLKIESPRGDFAHTQFPKYGGASTSYLGLNGGKTSAVLDLSGQDRAIFESLLHKADVLLYNFRAGVAERLGIDYESLKDRYPRLIVASATGYGLGGPYSHMRCTDTHAQAISGMASLNGYSDEQPFERFRWYGYIDCTTALVLANAILARLVIRQITGKGGYASTSMLASALHLQRTRLAANLSGGERRSRWGSASPFSATDDVFRTLDGYIAIHVREDEQVWAAFGRVFANTPAQWLSEWATPKARMSYRREIKEFLAAEFARQPSAYWEWKLRRTGVAIERVERHRNVAQDLRFWRRGALTSVTDRTPEKDALVVGSAPWLFNGLRPRVRPSPRRGEHTDEVLSGAWPGEHPSKGEDET